MDEPTAVLTPQEVTELFKIMQTLIDQGKSIIFITHKLGEELESAHKITVIRGGKVVGTTDPKTATLSELANMMVGREVKLEVDKTVQKAGDVVLEVRDLKVLDPRGSIAIDEINFEVRAGEVLGIAGVQGNGQTELVRSLTGLLTPIDGNVFLNGKDVTHFNPRQITEMGTAHIPEDRQKDGLVLSLPISDNLVLNTYYLKPYSNNAWLDQKVIIESGKKLVESFDIRTPSVFTSASSLSGGNQQKIIVAREFSRPIKLLIASQPTRGLDVGSIEYIHKRLLAKRDEGCAVLLVSTELDEIMQLSDRIAVLYRGKIIAIVDAKNATKEQLGLLMAGISSETEKMSN
jgi:simple sugar transport system ATP-binding protein